MNSIFPSITRRSMLENLALGTATMLSGSLAAFADTPVKGPIVWLDMDQQELDKAYSQFIYAPVIVAYGSYETPEFKRQSRDFAKAVADAGKRAQLIVAENYNHFEVIETLANPHGILGRAVLEQIQ